MSKTANLGLQTNSPFGFTQAGSGATTYDTDANFTALEAWLASTANNVTAFAGGGQASATALTSANNRITTVATAGDSVKLPAATVGQRIVITNAGANPCQVFGAGTDTINGVASATGVSQIKNSTVIYACTVAGNWDAEGIGCGFSGGLPTVSSTNGITAHAGGGQGSATPLTTVISRITTVAT